MNDPELIEELQLLDAIEKIAEEYEEEFGSAPTNVSIWDPASDVIDVNLVTTLPAMEGDGKDYIFSYILPDNAGLRVLMNYEDPRWRSLASHSGSASIVMICNWLRSFGAKKILILGPRYFTVPHCLNALGIEFETRYCERSASGYSLPTDFVLADYDGVWVTNPVYGTGVYLDLDDLLAMQKIWTRSNRFFVLDECLASVDSYAGPSLEPNRRTAIVAAPHKSICVNAYKFALSLFEQSQLEHFEHWSDIWLGCLPQSSYQAIEHVRDGGYHAYQGKFTAAIENPEREFRRLTETITEIELDPNAEGYFRTVYFPRLPANLGLDLNFLREATFSTGTSFIPGIRNELNPDVGLSFRVNLAAFDAEAIGGYLRLIRWIASKCRPDEHR